MSGQRKQCNNLGFMVFCVILLILLGYHPGLAQQSQTGKPAAGSPAGSPPATQTAPQVQVNETTFDFGEVFEGATVTHDFKVKNTGAGELQITQVRPG
jgi:hypothetical protein